jgi:integrase
VPANKRNSRSSWFNSVRSGCLGRHDFRHTYRAMMDQEKLTLEEQRVLMRHEDIHTTLGYGGKSKAETVRGANARVVDMLRKRA